jgi:putative lipoprotein
VNTLAFDTSFFESNIMSHSITRRQAIKFLTLASAALPASAAYAGKAVIKGEAFYLERIALPDNAVMEAQLLDISLQDAPAKILGKVIVDPAGQVPIPFKIYFNPKDQKPGHSYAVSANIRVDGKLIYANDTIHPALGEDHQGPYRIQLVPVR